MILNVFVFGNLVVLIEEFKMNDKNVALIQFLFWEKISWKQKKRKA